MVKLSVICPFYNEERYVTQCIDGLLSQDFPSSDMELLFVDGGSTDRSREIVESYRNRLPNIQVLDNPKRIVPVAMNLAIEKARGDVVMRLDMHATYAPNYFSSLVRNLEELKADNVGCPLQTDVLNRNNKSLAIREVLRSRFGVGNSLFRLGVDEVRSVDTVPFGCFPRSAFERFGKYDERLVRNQDIELNKRIVRNGGKIYLVPDTSCVYYARETFSALMKNNFMNGKWNVLTIFLTKDFRSLSIRHFVPMLFLLSWTLPLFLAFFLGWLIYLTIIVLSVYIVAVSIVSLRLSSKKNLSFISLVCAFIALHFSYGCGSLVGLFSLPWIKENV